MKGTKGEVKRFAELQVGVFVRLEVDRAEFPYSSRLEAFITHGLDESFSERFRGCVLGTTTPHAEHLGNVLEVWLVKCVALIADRDDKFCIVGDVTGTIYDRDEVGFCSLQESGPAIAYV